MSKAEPILPTIEGWEIVLAILLAAVPFIGWMPLPVKYRIYFGKPIYFDGDPEEDEGEIGRKVGEVKAAIDGLLKRGLAEREGLFS